MTADEFKKMTLDLEARGLIERNGERNGEIVWRLTEAGARSGHRSTQIGGENGMEDISATEWEELNMLMHILRQRFALCVRTMEQLRLDLADMDQFIGLCNHFVSRPEIADTLALAQAHRAEILARLQRQ